MVLRLWNINKYKVTNSMEQSPSWEANSSSARKEILCILWNMKVYYHVKRPCGLSLFSARIIKSMPPPSSYFYKIHFNITLTLMPKCSKWSLSLIFPHKISACTSPLHCMCHIPCLMSLIFEDSAVKNICKRDSWINRYIRRYFIDYTFSLLQLC